MILKGIATAIATTAVAALLVFTIGVFTGGSGTPGVEAQAAPATLDLDTDISDGACTDIDAVANVGVGATVQAAVCLNQPGTDPVAAFGYNIVYDDSIAVAPEVADAGAGLDDNPDANGGAAATTSFSTPDLGLGWDCTGGVGAYPKGDNNAAAGAGNGNAFSGGCGSAAGPNTLIDGPLGVVSFNALAIGSTTLAFNAATVTGDSLAEIGSCNPVVDTAMTCTGATINVLAPTATNTPTVTNTPGPTNTPSSGSVSGVTRTPTGTVTAPAATATTGGGTPPPPSTPRPTSPAATATRPTGVVGPDTGANPGEGGSAATTWAWIAVGMGAVLAGAGEFTRRRMVRSRR